MGAWPEQVRMTAPSRARRQHLRFRDAATRLARQAQHRGQAEARVRSDLLVEPRRKLDRLRLVLELCQDHAGERAVVEVQEDDLAAATYPVTAPGSCSERRSVDGRDGSVPTPALS